MRVSVRRHLFEGECLPVRNRCPHLKPVNSQNPHDGLLTDAHTHTHTHTTTHTNAHAGWTCVGSGIEHGRVFSSLFPRSTRHLLHPAVNLSSLSWIDHCTHMRRACVDVVQTEGGTHHMHMRLPVGSSSVPVSPAQVSLCIAGVSTNAEDAVCNTRAC